MALSSLERVRQKIGDRASIRRETIVADGVSDNFKLRFEPILTSPAPQVWANDVLQVDVTDYVVNYDQGIITFAVDVPVETKLVFQYYAVVWLDADLQDMLDQYSDNVNIAAAHILLSWAADVAKVAKRETRSGGGGLGAITQDTSVAARELRNTAKALMDWEIEYGDALGSQIAAEGLTEIPWTEAGFYQTEDQRWIREN